jgi:hypothetical protein
VRGIGLESADGKKPVTGGLKRRCRIGGFVVGLVVLGSGDISLASAGAIRSQAVLEVPGSTQFGAAPALSGDGNTLLVGDPTAGCAFVFTRSSGSWQLQQRLPVGGSATGTVALSADGTEALVGEVYAHHGGYNGFTEVFGRSGGSWHRVTALSQGTGAGVGAVSGNGRIAALFAGFGQVDLYAHMRRGWVSAGRVTGDRGTGFGAPLALSYGGGILLVGDAGAGAAPGAVDVYRRSGSSWLMQATLHDPNSSSHTNGFGNNLAMSWSGDTALVVGASGAYLFEHRASRWAVQTRFDTNRGVGAVSLSGNGERAVITPGGLSGWPTAGLYGTAGGRWVEVARLVGKPTAKNSLIGGTFPALSLDGSTVALGAPAGLNGLFGSNRHTLGSVQVFG